MSAAPARRLHGEVAVVLVLLVGAVPLLAGPAAARASEDASAWLEVLERAAEAARGTRYHGETLLVGRDGERSTMAKTQVRNTPEGGLEVGLAKGMRVRIGSDGGGLLDGGDRTVVPLPAVGFGAGDDFDRMRDKYDVTVAAADRLMDRLCTVVEIRRREDGALRERLWIDEESGLLIRRETFDGGEEPVRLATYLSLDLDPEPVLGGEAGEIQAPPESYEIAAEASDTAVTGGRGMEPVDARGLSALREAGWAVPPALPDGYAPIGAYAVDAGASQPLQLVYGDGLYVVSVFQQSGAPDWASLPEGAQRVAALDFPAYEWPGAVPPRLVWEAEGRTFSVVGDAPTADLVALASALPQPEPPGVLERLRRGLGRLWSWVTPWG